MSSIRATSRYGLCGLVIGVLLARATPAVAQEPSRSGSDVLAVAGGIDIVNQYMFRGVRQNSTGIAMWPFADLTVRAYSGDGPLRRIDVNVGFWNSLHTGDTGSGGPFGKPWYESRFSGMLAFQFGGGLSVASTYVAYTSPNNLFTTVKEIGIKLAVDDHAALGAAAVRPYALVAFELDTAPGMGQLDGGLHAGRYLELGATPEYSGKLASIAFPVKVGLSLRDYYELAGKDNTFGFVSIAGIVTVPLGRTSRAGQWNVHGGLEFQSLGETTKVFNGGDRSKTVALFGFGLKR